MPWDEETALGPTQSLTPEGFLIARAVPLARIGSQLYHPTELPMDAIGDADYGRMIEVDRPASEVFDPASIASFQGRPIVDDHPSDWVDPDNWQQHAIGTVINVRRGDPPDDDVLLGDLLFTTRRGIELVRNGKRAVSVGYDASYLRTGQNRARQQRIRVNHVALVDEGRCGPRCMIGDAKPRKGKTMKRTHDQTVLGEHNAWAGNVNFNNRMGANPGPVGPSLILELEGPSSAYFIMDLGPNRCGVVASAGINGKLDMPQIASGTGPLPRPPGRNVDAVMIRQQRDRDEAWCRSTLKGINAANKKAWGLA
jgi:hypothetical protein